MYKPNKYWAIHDWNVQVTAAKGRDALEKAGKLRPKNEARTEDESALKSGVTTDNGDQQTDEHTSRVKDADGDTEMSMITTPPTSPSTKEAPTKEAPKPQNYQEGRPSAKQLHETVAEFLTRLPPSKTSNIHAQDYWIWICNPFPKAPQSTAEDIPTFIQLGTRLLETYKTRKIELEDENPGKPPGSITRLLKPARLTLESSLVDLARAKGVLNGKWMLFPPVGTVDRVWEIVSNAIWDGKLGNIAKIATAQPSESEAAFESAFNDGENPGNARAVRDNGQRLICIYTVDFRDKDDVLRVLRKIKELGLINVDGLPVGAKGNAGSLKPIYYKCDAYTYLDIKGDNEYKLKASMYSSREMVPDWYPGQSGGGGGGGRGGWSRRS